MNNQTTNYTTGQSSQSQPASQQGRERSASSSGFSAKSHQAAENLKDAATSQAQHLRERADSAKEQAVNRIRRVGSALRSAGEGLKSDDEFFAQYANRASERVERVADYLSEADPRSVIRDAEDFARRNPAVFLGGAFLLGFAASRFLKSGQPIDERDDEGEFAGAENAPDYQAYTPSASGSGMTVAESITVVEDADPAWPETGTRKEGDS